MVEPGDTIENPVTGERFTFRRTGAQTGGAVAEFELALEPTAFLAAEHIHRVQEERFEVLEGRVRLRQRGQESVSGPGDVVVVPPGAPHTWAPMDGKAARILVTFTPGNRIEEFFDDFCRVAREGRTNSKGIPGPLVSARALLLHELYLARPPIPVQRASYRLLSGAASALRIR